MVASPKNALCGVLNHAAGYCDEGRVFRAYFTTGRGDEKLGDFWDFLDLTLFGRQENWEDSPEGLSRSEPYVWWRRHDEYDQVAKRDQV